MLITFDQDKDRSNRAKHGVSLSDAARVDWGDLLTWIDTREDYGEERQIALGPIGNTLYYIAFVERYGVIRVISMRKATNREIQKYVDES